MNKSQIFRKAHQIAKNDIERHAVAYKKVFARALRAVYAEMNAGDTTLPAGAIEYVMESLGYSMNNKKASARINAIKEVAKPEHFEMGAFGGLKYASAEICDLIEEYVIENA